MCFKGRGNLRHLQPNTSFLRHEGKLKCWCRESQDGVVQSHSRLTNETTFYRLLTPVIWRDNLSGSWEVGPGSAREQSSALELLHTIGLVRSLETVFLLPVHQGRKGEEWYTGNRDSWFADLNGVPECLSTNRVSGYSSFANERWILHHTYTECWWDRRTWYDLDINSSSWFRSLIIRQLGCLFQKEASSWFIFYQISGWIKKIRLSRDVSCTLHRRWMAVWLRVQPAGLSSMHITYTLGFLSEVQTEWGCFWVVQTFSSNSIDNWGENHDSSNFCQK